MQPPNDQTIRRSPVLFYLSTLPYMCAALALRALAFAPLASLWLFSETSPWRWLALLCPVLLIFVVLPLRFSFAQALTQKAPPRYFSFRRAVNFSEYGKKLREGLLHALSILKWGIPLAAVLAYGYYFYQGVSFSDLISAIQALGESVTQIYAGILGLFTDAEALQLTGGLMEGLYVTMGITLIAALILLLGVVRNSAYRYIWALAIREGLSPRVQARQRLHGRRFFQLAIGLVNLLLLVPFLVVVARMLTAVVGDIATAAMMALSGSSFPLNDLSVSVLPLLAAFLGLYFLPLPLRRMLTAYFATKALGRASAYTGGQSVVPGGEPVPAYVPSVSAADKPKAAPLPETPAPPLEEATTDEFLLAEDLQEPRKDVDSSAFTLGQ